MEWVRQWLLGAVACAMLVSVACHLCPDGATRQIARFVGGLLILCALLRPLAAWEPDAEAWDAPDYRAAVARAELELSRTAQSTLSDGIARELEAYIEDKAEGFGTAVRAKVTTDSRGVPVGAVLRGAYCEPLAEWIAAQIGIAKEKQVWIER